jgi:DNA primase
MGILEILSGYGLTPTKKAATRGGEYASGCPFCRAGEDRLRIWPSQGRDRIGKYWCRQCGAKGDAIQLLREMEKLDFRSACERVGVKLEEWKPKPIRLIERPLSKKAMLEPLRNELPSYALPNEVWVERARKLCEQAHQCLMDDRVEVEWFRGRGIGFGTMATQKLGVLRKDYWRPRDSWGLPAEGKKNRLGIPSGVVIPVTDEGGEIVRIRVRRFSGEPRYYVVPGSWMGPWLVGGGERGVVVVESELDALSVDEAAGDLVRVLALGSAASKPDAGLYARLKKARRILCALDFDRAGAKAWSWWRKHFPDNALRYPVPEGKDPGEAFALGVNLRAWVEVGLD